MFFRIHAFQGPVFLGSRFFRVQVFQRPGFSGYKFFRVRSRGPGPGSIVFDYEHKSFVSKQKLFQELSMQDWIRLAKSGRF